MKSSRKFILIGSNRRLPRKTTKWIGSCSLPFTDPVVNVQRLNAPGPAVKYVLITPARNEERFIAKTLESMVAQTMPPERWVIVDDGSTDKTSETVHTYAG